MFYIIKSLILGLLFYYHFFLIEKFKITVAFVQIIRMFVLLV